MTQINFNVGKSLVIAGAGATVGILNPAIGTYLSASQDNSFRRGVKVVVDICAISGGTTLTVVIEGFDQVSGKWYTILTSAALAAVATTALTVYPGVGTQANISASDILPKTWRIRAVTAVATSITATIGASLIL